MRKRLNHLFRLFAHRRDPQNLGDLTSWFTHYKWGVQGRVFLPVPVSVPIDTGDNLWFVWNGRLGGGVKILSVRAHTTMAAQCNEVEYDAEHVWVPTEDVSDPYPCTDEEDYKILEDGVHTSFMQACLYAGSS